MPFYENTIVAKEDIASSELETVKRKYSELINNSSGKVLKIEEWGLINFAKKIKNYRKGFFIHYKFEGSNQTIIEIKKKLKIDNSIVRHLLVKYKKLDIENEFFNQKKV